MTTTTDDILFSLPIGATMMLVCDPDDSNDTTLAVKYTDGSESWYARERDGWKLLASQNEIAGYSHACGYHD